MDVDEQVQGALAHASRTEPTKCLLLGTKTGNGCFLAETTEEAGEALVKCRSDDLLEIFTDENDKESPGTAKLTIKGIRFLVACTNIDDWSQLIKDTATCYREDVLKCVLKLLAEQDTKSKQTEATLALVNQQLIPSLSEECHRRQSELSQLKKELKTLYDIHTQSARIDDCPLKEEQPPQPKTDQDIIFIKSVLMELIVIWGDNSEGSETRSEIERALTNLGATKCHSRDDRVSYDHNTHLLTNIDDLTSLPKDVLIADPGWSFKNEDFSMTLLKAKAIPIDTCLDGTNDTSDHQSASTDDTSSNDLPVPRAAATDEVSNSSTQAPDNDTKTQTPNPESIAVTDVDCSTKSPPPVNEDDSSD